MPGFEEITRHSDADPTENPWVNGPPAAETVVIAPYNPDWPRRYQTLVAAIRTALGDTALDLEHVGSTSVEGLAAKDVIDIDLTVADPRDENSYLPPLEELGYCLTIREPSFHEHRCLRLATPRANLHVFGPACPEAVRHRMSATGCAPTPATACSTRTRNEQRSRLACSGAQPGWV